MEKLSDQQPEIHIMINALQHAVEAGDLSFNEAMEICEEYSMAYSMPIIESVIVDIQRRNALNTIMLDAFTSRRLEIGNGA